MRRKSEFARRITIVSSVLLSLAWFVILFIAILDDGFHKVPVLIAVGVGIIIFFIPFGVSRTIYWILEGIDKDKEALKKPKRLLRLS